MQIVELINILIDCAQLLETSEDLMPYLDHPPFKSIQSKINDRKAKPLDLLSYQQYRILLLLLHLQLAALSLPALLLYYSCPLPKNYGSGLSPIGSFVRISSIQQGPDFFAQSCQFEITVPRICCVEGVCILVLTEPRTHP